MRKITINIICILLICFLFPYAYADTDTPIKFVKFAAGKAWINIDGRIARLAPGQKSKEGFKLLSADRKKITLVVDGKRYRYEKGKIGGELLDNEVEILLNPINGSYYVQGAINGKDARLVVDTGASLVVINKRDARALNLKYGKKKIEVSTATRDEVAYLVTLETVRIGNIELKNIEAVVTNNEKHPRFPLLGMSFLKKLKISQYADRMTLSYMGE